jgi:ribosomal protein S18 acetylase RimI-like enzyme
MDDVGKAAEAFSLAHIANSLCQLAYEHGAELVQAISPLAPSRTSDLSRVSFTSLDPVRENALGGAHLRPVSKLVQMECLNIAAVEPLSLEFAVYRDFGEARMVDYEELAADQWRRLIEETYEKTLDVPELNGLRSIENTLEGYAASSVGAKQAWWAIECNGEFVGCLLLSPMPFYRVELTYVGIVPAWRGNGLAKWIMNFVREWAIEHELDLVTLAVDTRNIPAIRLYQSFGLTPQRFVQAWIGTPA